MIIYSFDCGVKSLGICCVEYKENFLNDIHKINKKILSTINKISNISNLEQLYKKILKIKKYVQNLSKILDDLEILPNISNTPNILLNSKIFNIIFINVIDFTEGKKVKDCDFIEISQKVKYSLHLLDSYLPKPDLVLIEKQMNINEKAIAVSRFIEGFYMTLKKSKLKFGIDKYDLCKIVNYENYENIIEYNTKVLIISPSLKNAVQVFKEEKCYLSYYNVKYTNYVANKKHTVYNLQQYLKYKGMHDLLNIDYKTK